MTSARQIVHDVLTEHANGDDPALAAAAQAELDWRQQQRIEASAARARAMGEGYRRMFQTVVDAMRPVAAFVQAFNEGLNASDE